MQNVDNTVQCVRLPTTAKNGRIELNKKKRHNNSMMIKDKFIAPVVGMYNRCDAPIYPNV